MAGYKYVCVSKLHCIKVTSLFIYFNQMYVVIVYFILIYLYFSSITIIIIFDDYSSHYSTYYNMINWGLWTHIVNAFH